MPRGGTSEPSGPDHTPAQISVLRPSALFRGCHRGAKAGSYPLLTAHSFRAELKSKMGSGFPVEGATNLNELGYHPGAKSTVIFRGLGYQKLVEIMIA